MSFWSFNTTGGLRAARFSWCLLLAATTAWAQPEQPEGASGFAPRPVAIGRRFMAVTANPHATEAAVEILRLGGSATDAAIAAQWVLNLVEPQSSGIGGGGFLLHWDARRQALSAWDGRETAPRRAASADFLRPDGSPLGYMDVVATGKSVGTPGLVAMLEAAHRRHGKLRWERLFRPAIRLAENGFPVSPRLHRLLADDPFLRRDEAARALYYHADGTPLRVGDTLRNPDLAATLREIAAHGAAPLQSGALAQRVVAAVAARGGALGADDLLEYRPRVREAICGPYRQWRVCGMPPPSSGGVGVLQLLGLLARSGPPGDPDAIDAMQRFAEAGRLVYADRARYLADPDFLPVPQAALLAPSYLDRRARLIDGRRSMGIAAPGELPEGQARADDDAPELPATSHLSIVDGQGNGVALTSSIESAFGSRILVGGFLLNNQLTDFSFQPIRDGRAVANRVEPGKRPLSSMAPTLVLDRRGRLHALLGSPGGSRIINYVARTLAAVLDDGRDPAAALALPHIGNRNGPTEIEAGRFSAAQKSALAARGQVLREVDMTSGLHLVLRSGERWLGAVDPRREGLARGE